jgi:hypothetical protein
MAFCKSTESSLSTLLARGTTTTQNARRSIRNARSQLRVLLVLIPIFFGNHAAVYIRAITELPSRTPVAHRQIAAAPGASGSKPLFPEVKP